MSASSQSKQPSPDDQRRHARKAARLERLQKIREASQGRRLSTDDQDSGASDDVERGLPSAQVAEAEDHARLLASQLPETPRFASYEDSEPKSSNADSLQTPASSIQEPTTGGYRRKLSKHAQRRYGNDSADAPPSAPSIRETSAQAGATVAPAALQPVQEEELQSLLVSLREEEEIIYLSKPRNWSALIKKQRASPLYSVSVSKLAEMLRCYKLDKSSEQSSDGLYRKKPAPVSLANALRLEQRLVIGQQHTGASTWLQPDGSCPDLVHTVATTITSTKPARLLSSSQELAMSQSASVQNIARLMDSRSDDMGDDNDPFETVTRKPMPPAEMTWPTQSVQELDVTLHSVAFYAHPLMDQETRLLCDLRRLVGLLMERQERETVQHLTSKILAKRAEYHTRKQRYLESISFKPERESPIRRKMHKTTPQPVGVYQLQQLKFQNEEIRLKRLEMARELRAWLIDLRALRLLRDTEAHIERVLEWRILNIYEELKALRAAQGYQSSGAKLAVMREECTVEDDVADLNTEIHEELQDAEELSVMEQEISNLERFSQPQLAQGDTQALKDLPAANIDRDALRDEIVRRFNVSRRTPGFPRLTFRMQAHEPATVAYECPTSEQKRRRQITATRLFVKLYYNDKFVTDTAPCHMTVENMTARMLDTPNFRLIVKGVPERLHAEIWEKGVLGDELLAQVILPTPKTSGAEGPRTVAFSAANSVPEHADQVSEVSGELKYEVTWQRRVSEDEGNRTLRAPAPVLADDRYGLMGALLHRVQRLAQYVTSMRQISDDESSSRMSGIFGAVDRIRTLLSLRPFFRFVQPPEFGQLGNSTRLQILQKRESGQVKVNGPLPMLDQDIDMRQLEWIEPETQELKVLAKERENLSSTRLVALSKRVRALQLRRHGALEQPLDVDTYVREARLPTPEADEENILAKLLRPRRPLRPEKQSRPAAIEDDRHPREAKVVVTILRGHNLPVRSTSPTRFGEGGRMNASRALLSEGESTHVYVEVDFQRSRRRTATMEGNYPEWNETIILPFRPPDGSFAPANLQTVNEVVYLHVYDEYSVNMLEDDRLREKSVHLRRERNWLGCCCIPFSTLYSERRVHGSLELQVPIAMFGYRRLRIDAGELDTPAPEETGRSQNASYLQVFVTLEPALPRAPLMQHRWLRLIKAQFVSEEGDQLIKYAAFWQKDARPHRFVLSTVLDLNGRTVHICRFIRAIAPPPSIETVSQAVRLVATIPPLEDRMALAADMEVWSTCEQFLELGAGDSPEHAILLCNFLLYMDELAYVVLGDAIPEGRTAYVLWQRTRTQSVLINAMTGSQYTLGEPHCPLSSIGCVFNDENVWMNVRPDNEDLSQLSLRLDNRAAWRPFFDIKMPLPAHFASVQSQELMYTTRPEAQIKQLGRHIEDLVRSSVEKWRRLPTRWNRLLNRLLSNLVTTFEPSILEGIQVDQTTHYQELERLQSTYRTVGFPLNISWRDDHSLVNLLHSTGVWDNDDPTAEFGLAVHCHSYLQGVTSVWVYVACLTKIRSR
ncbi:hypothetical protein RI367_008090 [Sorochytrium milnesiophthora]